MDWICPKCKKHLSGINSRTWCVACGECGTVVTRDMLKNLLPAQNGDFKKSPTIMFKGAGWTEKFYD